jgi:hypothetical protein
MNLRTITGLEVMNCLFVIHRCNIILSTAPFTVTNTQEDVNVKIVHCLVARIRIVSREYIT